jgi:hypothetical protein
MTKITINSQCPVLEEAQHVLDISHDLGKAMRRLRKKLNHCRKCEQEGSCPALKMFQDQIRAAIEETSQDWV